jgi:hypothetical protein
MAKRGRPKKPRPSNFRVNHKRTSEKSKARYQKLLELGKKRVCHSLDKLPCLLNKGLDKPTRNTLVQEHPTHSPLSATARQVKLLPSLAKAGWPQEAGDVLRGKAKELLKEIVPLLTQDCQNSYWGRAKPRGDPAVDLIRPVFSNLPRYAGSRDQQAKKACSLCSLVDVSKLPGSGCKVHCQGYVQKLLTGRRQQGGPVWELLHRLVCWLYRGGPPRGQGSSRMQVVHLCGIPNCINPLHLMWAHPYQNKAMMEWHSSSSDCLGRVYWRDAKKGQNYGPGKPRYVKRAQPPLQ